MSAAATKKPRVRQLRSFPRDCRALVSLAAVAGERCHLSWVGETNGWSRERLLRALDRILACGAAVKDEEHGEWFMLDPSVREGLLSELSPSARRKLHLSLARTIEKLHASDLDPHVPALARYFAEGGESRRGFEYWRRTAEMEMAACNYREAAAVCERALRVGDAGVARAAEQRELLLSLGVAQNAAGERETARTTLRKAAALARRAGDSSALVRAALAFADRPWPMAIVKDAEAVELLEEALAALSEGDSALRSALLARLSRDVAANVRERRDEISAEAVEIARRVEDPALSAQALIHRHWATWMPERLDERIADSFGALRAAEEAGSPELELQARSALIVGLVEAGNLRGADVEIETYEIAAERLKQPAYLSWAAIYRAMRRLLTGHFEDADALGRRMLEICDHAQNPAGPVWFTAFQLVLCRERGALDAFLVAFDETLRQSPCDPWWRTVTAFASAALGRHEVARQELENLAVKGFVEIPRDLSWLGMLTLLADACCDLEDTPSAETLYELLVPYLTRNAIIGAAAVSLGSVSRPLGRLATVLDRFDAAEPHFERASAFHTEWGARPWLAYTQYDHARMLLRRGRSEETDRAGALLREAAATARELGMKALELKIHEIGEPSAPGQTPSEEPAMIFRREGDYWTLRFDGTTVRLKAIRGLAYLAVLLRHPDRELHVTELAAAVEAPIRTNVEATGAAGLAAEGLGIVTDSDAGAILDETATRAYRGRLRELSEELDEAEQLNDLGRISRLRNEKEMLTGELSAALGLGSRSRRSGSRAEAARLRIVKAIRIAMSRIEGAHPALAGHLARTVRTGTFCVYTPDPRLPAHWVS